MNIVLYLDTKSFGISPDDLVKRIKKTHIKGFEVSIDVYNEEEKNYLRRLATLCKDNDLILILHAHIVEDIESQLDFYGEIANIYGKINAFNHPISSDNIYLSQEKTNILFSKIINYIELKKYDISFGIENLSSRKGTVRLSKDMLLPILSNNEKLNFTYNLGNEFRDFGKITNVNPLFIKRLNIVHIYSFDYKNIHKAITKKDPNKVNIVKGLTYLKQILYVGPIVLDYDFDLLGLTTEEKLDNYITNAESIYEYIA